MDTNAITFVGDFRDFGAAYPVINRALYGAWSALGHTVIQNAHNHDATITPLAVAHEYPLRSLNLRHDRNVIMTAWEFAGAHGLPRQKVSVINTFDKLLVPSDWLVDELAAQVDVPVQAIRWGVDINIFTPTGDTYPLPNLAGKVKLLWLGGTDKRHGFDLALQIIAKLPERYHLIAKQSAHYPPIPAEGERLTIIREDMDTRTLASLYRACDAFLHPVRGVGFSLPVLEALACGLPVVASHLPPLAAFGDGVTLVSGGTWERVRHHLYSDCEPFWYAPSVDNFVAALQAPLETPPPLDKRWTWQAAALDIWSALWN